MARELATYAILGTEPVVDVTLWLGLSTTYSTYGLYRSIASQVFQHLEEWVDDDAEELELCDLLKAKLKGKKYLIVLDDEGNRMSEEEIMPMLNNLLDPKMTMSSKVLITRINEGSCQSSTKTVEVRRLIPTESSSFLKERAGTEMLARNVSQRLSTIVEKCRGLPIEIVFRATALRYVLGNEQCELKRSCALQEATKVDNYWMLHSGYDKFMNSIAVKCFWIGKHYLEELGSVHYNELISCWIIEGCAGSFNCIRKAYEELLDVLMELIGAGLLGQGAHDYVVIERAGINFANYSSKYCYQKPEPRLLHIIKELGGLGKIQYLSGKMVGFKRSKGKLNPFTLLVDGNSYSQMTPSTVTQLADELQVFSIFQPTFDSLPQSVCMMDKLQMLVLRNCTSLNNLCDIVASQALSVLEISGPCYAKTLPHNLLPQNLQSLNLSSLLIETLPSSISTLTQLRYLVLKNCNQLKTLPSLKHLREIESVDLAGCTMLEEFDDHSFDANPKLQVLDVSNTNLYEFPVIKNLKEVTSIVVKGCPRFNKARDLSRLNKLQVLDYSNCSNIKVIRENSLPNSDVLITLDLSGTKIENLPLDNIKNLYHLCLKGCDELENLPSLSKLTNLQTLDLAGASKLTEIEGSFEDLKQLQFLELSETQVKMLPVLSNPSNLRALIFKNCKCLESLPNVEGLISLQVLDLSGCIALKSNADDRNPFSHMSRLIKLDLSGTKIECASSFTNLNNF